MAPILRFYIYSQLTHYFTKLQEQLSTETERSAELQKLLAEASEQLKASEEELMERVSNNLKKQHEASYLALLEKNRELTAQLEEYSEELAELRQSVQDLLLEKGEHFLPQSYFNLMTLTALWISEETDHAMEEMQDAHEQELEALNAQIRELQEKLRIAEENKVATLGM